MKVWAEGDRLRLNAPTGVLTPDLQAELTARKPEILTLLRATEAWAAPESALVPIQPGGARVPFFGVPGHNGDVFCYVRLSRHLGAAQPLYALEPPGVTHGAPLREIEALAAHFVGQLLAFHPVGPFQLGGYCLGGVTAFEVARQLAARGRTITLLALFETPCPTARWLRHAVPATLRYLARGVARQRTKMALLPRGARLSYAVGKARDILSRFRGAQGGMGTPATSPVEGATLTAVRVYTAQRYPGPVTVLLPSPEAARLSYGRLLDWGRFAAGGMDVHTGPAGCPSGGMLLDPWVETTAARLRDCLARAGAGR